MKEININGSVLHLDPFCPSLGWGWEGLAHVSGSKERKGGVQGDGEQ